MTYKIIIAVFVLVGTVPLMQSLSEAASTTDIVYTAPARTIDTQILTLPSSTSPVTEQLINEPMTEIELTTEVDGTKRAENPSEAEPTDIISAESSGVFTVPFFSQFNDITPIEWRKVGCGIASLAMLIEFYEPNSVSVDELLQQGIKAGAYLNDTGWTHAGLINLSKKYGLDGASHDMAGLSMEAAFTTLKNVLEMGPVMVSVHYTFDPKNPIPHLVVINGVYDGKVYYNDPAEKSGGGSISISKFQSAWKKRYIQIQTTS